MLTFITSSLVLLLATSISALSCPTSLPASCAGPVADSCCSPRYGVVVLSLQWIPNYGPKDQFTIHGLWPNTCSNGRVNGCDPKRQYGDIASTMKEAGLLNEMNLKWPSFKGDNNAFWVHEWGKHGTCVTTLNPSCFSEYKPRQEVAAYFRKVLELQTTYDVFSAITQAGIGQTTDRTKGVPVSTYMAAVKQKYGVDVEFKCRGSVITDVNLYFNVMGAETYVPINSPLSSSSCRGNTILPPKKVEETTLLRWQREFEYEWVQGGQGVAIE